MLFYDRDRRYMGYRIRISKKKKKSKSMYLIDGKSINDDCTEEREC